MKDIGFIKELALLLYLMPCWGVLFILDICAKVCKARYKNHWNAALSVEYYGKLLIFGYKTFHIAGEHVSRHVTKIMHDNKLDRG